MKIEWINSPLFKKTPLVLVIAVVIFIGFNVYLNIKINDAKQEIKLVEKAATEPLRKVPLQFAKKNETVKTNCPFATAGNPNAPLKFKLFESETCPFCVAQDKVMDEILPQYGDLFYGEWYEVINCPNQSKQYNISGVPTFVFTAQGQEKPPAYGFLDKEQLIDYICRVSGKC